jgi:F0F1-type ATP synthase assembly protein I
MYVDKNNKAVDEGTCMEPINRSNIEVYTEYITSVQKIMAIVTGVIIAILIFRWIMNPESGLGIVILLLIGLYISSLILSMKFNRISIILTPEAFIQTGINKVILWKEVDHIRCHSGRVRNLLYIYYRENEKIYRFPTNYPSVGNKKELLHSLKKFSEKYGFPFEIEPADKNIKQLIYTES